jgi:PAS domain S-box-containing protein
MKAYEGIFEVIPDAVLVVDLDGHIVRANAQCLQLFGYGDDELVGMPVEFLIPERFAARHAAYRARYVVAPRVRPLGARLDL